MVVEPAAIRADTLGTAAVFAVYTFLSDGPDATNLLGNFPSKSAILAAFQGRPAPFWGPVFTQFSGE